MGGGGGGDFCGVYMIKVNLTFDTGHSHNSLHKSATKEGLNLTSSKSLFVEDHCKTVYSLHTPAAQECNLVFICI